MFDLLSWNYKSYSKLSQKYKLSKSESTIEAINIINEHMIITNVFNNYLNSSSVLP